MKHDFCPKTKLAAAIKPIPVFIIVCMIAFASHAFALVTIQEQVVLNGYSFYGKAVLDLIDDNDNTISYESDSSGNFNFQLSQPGIYDVNIRHNTGDFEWKQFFGCSFVEGINSISSGTLALNYNPDRSITVPGDYPTIQGALDAVQSGGWVVVSAQANPYVVNGLHWENKHVKLLGQAGTTLTLGYGDTSHAIYLTWSGINRTDLIRGFTLQNCQINASDFYEAYGPAITLKNSASPTIENCSFNENHVQSYYDLEFNNPRGYGGAVFIEGGTNQTQSPYFTGCIFTNNNAGNANGGGAVAMFGPGEFVNCTFSSNWTTTAVGSTNAAFAAGAILILSENHTGTIKIDNCTFSDNYGQNKANDIWIAKSSGISEVRITNSTFNQSVSHYYFQPVIRIFDGVLPIQANATAFYVEGNRFNLTNRGAVDFHDSYGISSLWFNKNTVIGVTNAYYGLYLHSNNPIVAGQDYFSFNNNTLRNLTQSGLVLYQGSSYTINNNIFDNCAPYDIKWTGESAGLDPTESLTINNCYFNDLANHVDTTGNPEQTYTANNLVVAASPQLGTNHEPLWNNTVISLVIDKGVESISDPDGTPSDIGAIRAGDHKYEKYTMPGSSGNKWMSFPVLNGITNAYCMNGNFFNPILDDEWLQLIQYKPHNSPRKIIYWYGNDWTNYYDTVNSLQGYKIQMLAGAPSGLEIKTTGYLQAPHTVIPLNQGENWLGYFQETSSKPLDALAPILNNISTIQTQNWTMTKVQGFGWIHNSSWVINYGDLVVVTADQECSFSWNNAQPVDPKSVPKAKEFVYTEKLDYTPFYLTIPESKTAELPSEIGLYVNGICKGAAVVEEDLTHICAYLDAGEEITPENSNLVFYYSNKAIPNNKGIYKMAPGQLSKVKAATTYYTMKITDLDKVTPVPIEAILHQNYPNPFNPSTTIAYDLPEDGAVQISVYNIKGQLVQKLLDKPQGIGSHSVIWNGKDAAGSACASGVYYCKLTSKGKSITKKMLLMK